MNYIPFILCVMFALVVLVNFVFFFLKRTRDDTIKKRLAIPAPERKRVLAKLYSLVMNCADATGARPFLIYGSLLGKVRHDDIICYDFDIDLGIDIKEYDKIKEELLKLQSDEISVNVKDYLGFKTIEIVDRATRLNADIMPYRICQRGVCRCVPEIYSRCVARERKHYFERNEIYPLKESTFLGRKCFLPNDPGAMLSSWYSDRYMIPDKICDADCANCVANPDA